MMGEFLSNYGLWILLAAVFVGMHWFGRGCCGASRRAAGDIKEDRDTGEKTPADASRRSGVCH